MEKHIGTNSYLYILQNSLTEQACHEGLWNTMLTYGISKELIDMITALCASSGISILINNQRSEIHSQQHNVFVNIVFISCTFNIFYILTYFEEDYARYTKRILLHYIYGW